MSGSSTRTVPVTIEPEQTVGDVMLRNPKVLPPGALVGDVRRMFERPNVRTALLADESGFYGAIERDQLPANAPVDAPAADYAERDPATATPDTPVVDALELLARRGEPRLIVLDDDGSTLRGLVCLNSAGTSFCTR